MAWPMVKGTVAEEVRLGITGPRGHDFSWTMVVPLNREGSQSSSESLPV